MLSGIRQMAAPCYSVIFLPRDAMHSADYAVTRRYFVKKAKYIIKLYHSRVATPFKFFHTGSKRYDNIALATP